VDKVINHFEAEERDIVDDIDLFYSINKRAGVADPLEDAKEIPYDDHSEQQSQALQAALSAFEQKFGKFTDIMIARYQKKKEEKMLKKKQKEQERQQH
jgi:hypothetical protein